MNREQAENILDAYACMRIREYDKDASDALREVILDAMTETYPYATWVDATKLSTNWDGTPKVTCTGLTVNGMEVFRVHHGPEAKVVSE